MKNRLKVNLLLIVAALMACIGCRRAENRVQVPIEKEKRKAVYHWKTVFELDSAETEFLQKHDIGRIYLKMFDVVVEQNFQSGMQEIVPVATTRFVSSVPAGMDVVPVTYITIEALRAMEGKETEFATLVVERLLAMCTYNKCGTITELQLDCDWTSSTKDSYNRLCEEVKKRLKEKGIALSVTIRLHQLSESAPPVDRGVLMVYNTGILTRTETKNSILDINDARPYIKPAEYPIPLACAYPVFGWGVKFKDGKFVSIVADKEEIQTDGEHIRRERPTPQEIFQVKQLVESKLGKPVNGNILYHLDYSQLENYTDDEISQILSF